MSIKPFPGATMRNHSPPILGFCAWSGTGKTTLITKVLPLLNAAGLRVGVIKHAHHEFDIDHPGKDSYRIRKAGATQMLVGSRERWALMAEATVPDTEPRLANLLPRLDTAALDLILVEGFKHEAYPKIELQRVSMNKPMIYEQDTDVIAFATDRPENVQVALPVLDINRPEEIAEFIRQYVRGFSNVPAGKRAP